MKGMSTRTTYFFKGNNYEPEPLIILKNGNRLATAKIVRPMTDQYVYVVTGWDMQMNTVKEKVNSMSEAIELSLTLLGGTAKIRPVSKK